MSARCARGAREGLRFAALLGLALGLGACAATDSVNDLTKIEYQTATKAAPLEIPPDLVTPRTEDRYAVPERTSSTTYSAFAKERATAPKPGEATLSVLPQVPGARIERQGNQRWLVVDLPPEKVWPVLRTFWVESGFVLKVDSPETGVMETDWAETRPVVPDDSWFRKQMVRLLNTFYTTGDRDKFRTRVESSGASTEIFVSNRGLTEELVGVGAQADVTKWVWKPPDPDLEAEFLRRIMLRFSPQRTAAAASAAPAGSAAGGGAAAAAAPPKASVVTVGGVPYVKMQDDFDRSWRQVGLALDRSGFTVEDRDRSKGSYYVRYVDPTQEGATKGLLDKVFGTSSKKDLAGKRYRIVVAPEAPGARVGVLDEDGSAPTAEADRRVAGQIVTLLQEQLK